MTLLADIAATESVDAVSGVAISDGPLTDHLRATVDEAVIAKAVRISKSGGPDGGQRTALLGVLLARLADVSFEETARLLGISEAKLVRYAHGEEPISRDYERRWDVLAQIVYNVSCVLEPAALPQWASTSVPALGGATPADQIRRGHLDRVLELTRSYLNPSFS
ncbi:hypothetical protein ACFQ9V_10530 [Leifsonia sp. NPDC056665]|uniref:hypothetical protein n=1 Tax=Leifsonia sp. NPDC056665 TaxID=3345901 RepID=UPI003684DEE6